MVCRYFLTIGDEEFQIPSTDLKNWDEIEYSVKRSDFSGLVRSFSSKFEFVGQTADMLTSVFLKKRLYASAFIKVQGARDDWTFETLFSCPLDFASYESEDGVVKMNAIDRSLSAYIKSNKNKKYEYNMATDFVRPTDPVPSNVPTTLSAGAIPEEEKSKYWNKPFRYDSLYLDNVAFFEVGTNEKGEIIRDLKFLSGQEFQKIPIEKIGESIIDQKGIESTTQDAEGFKVLTAEEMKKVGAHVPLEMKFPYGSDTSGENYIVCNTNGVLNGFTNVDVNIEFELKIPELVNVKDLEFYISTARGTDKGHEGNIYNIIGLSPTVQSWSIPMIEDKELAKKRIFRYKLKKGFTLYDGFILVVLARVKRTGDVITQVIKSNLSVRWKTRKKPDYIDYVTPYQLLQNLVESMTAKSGKEYRCKIAISNNKGDATDFTWLGFESAEEERLPHVILVPNDAITRNPDKSRFIKTSFEEYCKWMEAVFGYVWRIEIIDGFETVVFRHRVEVMTPNGRAGSRSFFTEVNDLKYKTSKLANISAVEIGYDIKDDDNDNFRYEFNKTVVYDTGILNTEKKLSLISPYRADSIGFEITYQDGFNNAQEDKSTHDGIWCVYAPIDYVKNQRKAGETKYVSMQDYPHSGLFNYYLSPVFNLKANSRYISSFVNKLLMSTVNVNNFRITVDDVKDLVLKSDWISIKDTDGTEVGPFLFYKWPLMGIGEITFRSSYIFPSDYDSIMTVQWMGRKYRGWIKELKNKYERTESSECTMLEIEIKDI